MLFTEWLTKNGFAYKRHPANEELILLTDKKWRWISPFAENVFVDTATIFEQGPDPSGADVYRVQERSGSYRLKIYQMTECTGEISKWENPPEDSVKAGEASPGPWAAAGGYIWDAQGKPLMIHHYADRRHPANLDLAAAAWELRDALEALFAVVDGPSLLMEHAHNVLVKAGKSPASPSTVTIDAKRRAGKKGAVCPELGSALVQELAVRICGKCGYEIDNGLCSQDCEQDGGPHPAQFMRVYERTDKFLRDEPSYEASNRRREG